VIASSCCSTRRPLFVGRAISSGKQFGKMFDRNGRPGPFVRFLERSIAKIDSV
jgi:hypothetical protein